LRQLRPYSILRDIDVALARFIAPDANPHPTYHVVGQASVVPQMSATTPSGMTNAAVAVSRFFVF